MRDRSEYLALYRDLNRERLRVEGATFRATHREKILEYRQRHLLKHGHECSTCRAPTRSIRRICMKCQKVTREEMLAALKSEKKRKYGNEQSKGPCSYGFAHRSLLEHAVCDQLAWQEKAGQVRVIAHEDVLHLSPARYRYTPDFKIEAVVATKLHEAGEVYWVEAKGGAGDQRWPTTKRMWAAFGPGKLEIHGGRHDRPAMIRMIVPIPSAGAE